MENLRDLFERCFESVHGFLAIVRNTGFLIYLFILLSLPLLAAFLFSGMTIEILVELVKAPLYIYQTMISMLNSVWRNPWLILGAAINLILVCAFVYFNFEFSSGDRKVIRGRRIDSADDVRRRLAERSNPTIRSSTTNRPPRATLPGRTEPRRRSSR